MIFLHDSLKTKKFETDNKLNLLKRGIITPTQFINLIEPTDKYVLFGPTIIDKTKIKDFIIEWKNHQLNVDSAIQEKVDALHIDDIIKNFDIIENHYPEVSPIIQQYNEQIKYATCPKCTKNHHLTAIVALINKLRENGDSRDLGDDAEFIETTLNKFSAAYSNDVTVNSYNEYDVEWIKPENLIGIGYDLIDKLESCFECSIKHIGRAKILFEESNLGYPEHAEIMMDELVKGNKDLEQLYLKYMDACVELDMGSSELVGNIVDLNPNSATEILELANKIRQQRLLFQEDHTKVPEFDDLRLSIKKLELKVRKQLELNK